MNKPKDHGFYIVQPMKDGDEWGVYGPDGIICCERFHATAILRVIDEAIKYYENN